MAHLAQTLLFHFVPAKVKIIYELEVKTIQPTTVAHGTVAPVDGTDQQMLIFGYDF